MATHCVLLTSSNALDILTSYDIIVDATDNVATRYTSHAAGGYQMVWVVMWAGFVPLRYLLNDACVLLGKPLVSGSALRFEGQLTVYGWHGGPCYRCLFPSPPPPHTVTNCSEGGVLGVGEEDIHWAVPPLTLTLHLLPTPPTASRLHPLHTQCPALLGLCRHLRFSR